MHIHHVGMLRSWASWSKVMREHLVALQQLGQSVSSRELTEEDRYDANFPLQESLASIPTHPSNGRDAVTITFSPPQMYEKIGGESPLVGFLTYEATRWPEDWVQHARDNLSLAIVASSFNYRGLIESGFPEEDVAIVPYGFNRAVYHPAESDTKTGDTFKIIYIGTPSRKNGLDVFLRGVSNAFEPEDDVEIILKVNPYDGSRLDMEYVIGDWRAQCLQLEAEGHQVRTIFEEVSESELASLYREADLYCLPSRGEGFGLTAVEAMACETTPLVTGSGALLDVVNENYGLLLTEYDHIDATSKYLGSPPGGSVDARLVEPDVDELALALERAYQNPELIATMGKTARQMIKSLTFRRVTRTLVRTLERRFPELA